jgi:hypothetical protein
MIMSLFKTDPLLAFCKLIAWLIFVGLCASLLFCVVFGLVGLIGGARFEGILRQSYPELQAGVAPLFALAMACIAVALGLMIRFMRALLAIIRSVQDGEAFTLANAGRVRFMAWLSLISMPVGLFIGGALDLLAKQLGRAAPDAGTHIERFNGLGFGWGQLMLTLLLFVLARLFAQAATMRDEIEGTV